MTNTPETQADAFFRAVNDQGISALQDFDGIAKFVGENIVFDFADDSVLVIDRLGNRVGVH